MTRTEFDILTGDTKKYPRELVEGQQKIFRERGLLSGDTLTAENYAR